MVFENFALNFALICVIFQCSQVLCLSQIITNDDENQFCPGTSAKMLQGKVCVVTGSSTGIGAATAIKLAKEGADGIVLHGRNVDGLNKVKNKCIQNGINEKNVIIIVGDITAESVQQKLINDTIKHFGRLDVLVNNAGIMDMGNTMGSSMEIFDRVHNVNVRSLVALTKLAVPHLISTKGNIVNLSTVLALKPIPTATFYNMGKAAIDHFTRCLALELGPSGVRVNSVNPGYIPNTELFSRQEPGAAIDEEEFRNSVPMRAFATVEDVAEAIAWLAGKATMTTGHSLPVDAGYNIA